MNTNSITAAGALLSMVAALWSCSDKPDYDATGIFEATTVTVSAETTGKILSFDVEEGDSIILGQCIAAIDSTELLLRRSQIGKQESSTRTSAPSIPAQASALRAQIAHQENEVNRFARLYADGAGTQKQLDDAKAYLATLRGQLEALLSTLGKSSNSLGDNAMALQYQSEQLSEQIAKSNVKSPITGTVLVKYAQEGEFAVPGKPLVKMADLNRIYIRSYFTASQLANVKLGQKVTVIADFGGDEQYEYPGTITWIAEESEFTPKSIQTRDSRANLVYAVKIAVRNDGRLKLGQYGEVRL